MSYANGANPRIDYIRLLIADTNTSAEIFTDGEIESAYQIQASFFQSFQFFSPPAGRFLPQAPVSYLRVAALLLDSLAANSARLSSVIQLLDVKLDASKAAGALRDQARSYRDVDDDSGAMAMIEQCSTSWAISDRFWAQVQRQQGVGF